jgi:hypothetical protein
MKVRTTSARPGLSARLAITGCGTMALLASITLSACSGSTPSAGPSVSFSPGGTGSPTPSTSASSTATASSSTATASDSASASPRSTETVPPTPTPTPNTHTHTHQASASPVPAAAPATGGGGTAGFQDTLLFGLGGAAILAGAGTMVYRRRVIRSR